MAGTWWQRLKRSLEKPAAAEFRFRIADAVAGGWWLRAESKPVRVGLKAAATPVPALMTAWTFHTPPPPEPPLPRGAERLALLQEWGRVFAAAA